MKIYNYHATTNEFTGSSIAGSNPMEPGKFLMPANATATPPPTVKVNQAVVFVNNIWSVVADYRGKIFYKTDGSEVTLKLGDIPAPSLLKTVPANVKLNRIKEAKRTEIRQAFSADISTPIVVAGVLYHAGMDSGIKLDGAARLAAKAKQANVTYTDINNVPKKLTLAQADAVIIAVGMDYQAKFLRKQKAMVNIANAVDLAAVNAITY